jgi:hypothetical protein
MKVHGSFIGQYTYGEGYPQQQIGTSVSFEMMLTARGVEFFGYCIDEATKLVFPEGAEVIGLIENNMISFDKRYPKAVQLDENGFTTVIEDGIPPLIQYEGELFGERFEGVWEIHQHYKENEEVFSIMIGSGTWAMWAKYAQQ